MTAYLARKTITFLLLQVAGLHDAGNRFLAKRCMFMGAVGLKLQEFSCIDDKRFVLNGYFEPARSDEHIFILPDKIGHRFGNRLRGGNCLLPVVDNPHDPCHVSAQHHHDLLALSILLHLTRSKAMGHIPVV